MGQPEGLNDMNAFLDIAFEKVAVANTIQCPGSKCIIMAYKECKKFTLDLLKFRRAQSYTKWTFHGIGEEWVNEMFGNSEGTDNEDIILLGFLS